MKITNWCRKLAYSLAAAGCLAPSVASAQVIPLGDPSFEDFVVPASPGYAYADTYRPTSAWVSNPDMANQDTAASNWLYDSAYDNNRRPAPRTGNQVMHGINNYSGQETSAVFEAEKTYVFSVWAQGDSDATLSTSRTWLYIYDGSNPFTEPGSLNFARYAPDTGDFVNRVPGSTPAQSQANWTQISIMHTVQPGAPEIGNPVGVAFWTAGDGAVDDATLEAFPADQFVMILEVNTTTGVATMKNNTGAPIPIDYYEIMSANGDGDSLDPTGWNSLEDQDLAGFPAGNGSGNGWEEAGGADSDTLSESYLTGNSAVPDQASISLGALFDTGDPQDLTFRYAVVPSTGGSLDADFDGSGDVNGDDFVDWQRNFPASLDAGDLANWQDEYGSSGGPSGPGELTTGLVRYVTGTTASAVPEPAAVLLAGIGLATGLLSRKGCQRS